MAATKRQAVVLVGPPGSGKGTQGRALGNLPHLVHYEMGESLRRIDESSELGRRIHAETASGRLLPDELVLQVFDEDVERLEEEGELRPEEQVLLLDGLPRTLRQAEELSRRLDLLGAIELDVDDVTELYERLQRRGLENGRIDDVSESVIEERIRQYERESRPVLDALDRESVRSVDASEGPLEVLGRVVGALQQLLGEKRPRVRPKPDSDEPKGSEWRSLR